MKYSYMKNGKMLLIVIFLVNYTNTTILSNKELERYGVKNLINEDSKKPYNDGLNINVFITNTIHSSIESKTTSFETKEQMAIPLTCTTKTFITKTEACGTQTPYPPENVIEGRSNLP